MDAKAVAVLALVLAALCLSDGKPVSLSYRCPCRFFESHVARANVKHLKILNTPNCALQIVPQSGKLIKLAMEEAKPRSFFLGLAEGWYLPSSDVEPLQVSPGVPESTSGLEAHLDAVQTPPAGSRN